MLGWLFLGLILLAATVVAGYTYSVVRAENITTEAALAQLGISTFAFLGIRAILAGGLVALSGWTRYVGRPKVIRSADEEVAMIERQRKIEAAKSKLNRQRAANAVKFGKSAINAAFAKDEVDETEEDDDTGPKSSSDTSDNAGEVSAETATRNHRGRREKRIYSLSEARKFHQARDNGSAQARVFAFLDRHPSAPLSQIMSATGVGKGTASKYKRAHKERQDGTRQAARG